MSTREPLLPPSCQSCGLPLKHLSDFGTNESGAVHAYYCRFCYQKGRFTEPDITMEEIIDKVARTMAEQKKITEEQARERARKIIPQLKRWKKD